ncbi:MAG: AAA family ATPase [Bacteroidaceae bacterium]|nr:AAA family ATPase [Bacteroidaceae bacterium]
MVPFKETINTKQELIEACKKGFEAYSNKRISKNDFCMYFGFTHGKAITTFYEGDYEQLLIDGGFNSGSGAYFSGGINAWKNLRDGKYIFPPFVQDESKPHHDNELPHQHINNKIFDYRPYITAIKSKPFLLLAGISGTGKSRIVRELARACWDADSEEFNAQKPRNFEMVQVKPNWHDSSELIGYVSRVGEKPVYVAGDFLKFVAKAWKEAEDSVPYFLCLDEMNLAPVEQYFAEYLSVVESRKADSEGNITTDPILKKSQEDWYRVLTSELTDDDEIRNRFLEDGICIPQNLIVVGTVNMDETTFSFSRKVLDRAMTIEMNEVDLSGGLANKYEQIGKLGTAELIGNVVEGVDIYSSYKSVCDTAIAYLQKVNDKLEGTPFKIAYRTRNEVLLYVVNNLPYNQIEGDEEQIWKEEFVIARALDEITNMKILSRIEGDESKVSKTFLEELGKVIKEQLEEISGCLFGLEETDEVFKSISLTKIEEMKKRLDSGYTSFWS